MKHLLVRTADSQDLGELALMCHSLWPDASAAEHARELGPLLAARAVGGLPWIVLLAQEADGPIVGFIQVDLRSHADGCDYHQPVGYLEGWYVAPAHRRRGIGARLVAAAEEWARNQGCVEMASDTWLDNPVSQCAHEAFGYEVVDRCVHYRKPL